MIVRLMSVVLLWSILGCCGTALAAEEMYESLLQPVREGCDFAMEAPHYFVKGNGSVGDDHYMESDRNKMDRVCENASSQSNDFEFLVAYYLTNGALTPNEASKKLSFYVSTDTELEKALTDRGMTHIGRALDGHVDEFPSPSPDETVCSNREIRHEVSEIIGPNWHGWIVEKIYSPLPKSKRSLAYCQVYTKKYRCLSLLIGNEKMSVTGGPDCLLREADHSLHEAMSYDTYLKMVKSIRLRE